MSESTTTRRTPATGLLDQALADGWELGPPDHVHPESLAIDAALAFELVCDTCAGLGLSFTALHRGRQYRCLGSCPRCGQEVEL